MACARCHAPRAEFFTTDGQSVCRVCFYAEQVAIQDARAEESLAAELPAGIEPAKNPKPPKPGRVMWTGIALVLAGLAATALMYLLTGDIEDRFLLISAFGFATAARGYKVRQFQ